MVLKETLRSVAKAQRESFKEKKGFIEREGTSKINLDIPFALIISGIRRCGKSTLLLHLSKNVKSFYYLNFDDLNLTGFELSDFQRLDDVFKQEWGESKYYFFDEIQNVEKWELFVRSRLDQGKHFVITGSNASLLSRELGTRLTGRHLGHELFPFSYAERLKLLGKKHSPAELKDFLLHGGFPEYLKLNEREVLIELLNDIISRDILLRHKIRNAKVLKQLAIYLFSNVGSEITFNSLKKLFSFGSINSVISYLSYFEDSYLFFLVPQYEFSIKKQLVRPKKVYSIDNGLTSANSASFSNNLERMLENSVFLELKKRFDEIYYFKGNHECDFIAKSKNKEVLIVQSCYELNEENKEREVQGLYEALVKARLKEGFIVTLDQEDEFAFKGKTIKLIPYVKFVDMLKKESNV